VPGTAGPKPRYWWRGIVVSDSHCEKPGCNHTLHEHNPAEAFAYTIGLHDRLGLPELHLSATPRDCSEMPVMQVYDLGHVLNAFTERYLADGGAPTKARIRGWPGGFDVYLSVPGTDVAVPQWVLECHQAHDDALALPISWCAHRPETNGRSPAA